MFGVALPQVEGHALCRMCAPACRSTAPFICRTLGRAAPRFQNFRTPRAVAEKAEKVPYEVGTDVEEIDPEIRRYLSRRGWHKSWIDVVEERVIKREFTTTPENVESIVTYLEGLGIDIQQICNMAALVPKILGQNIKTQLEPVVEHIKSRGLTGAALVEVLEVYPKLLIYEVAPGGKMLQRGKARAKVDLTAVNGKGPTVNVHFWREGAAFQTAPVSPWKPGDT